MPARPPEPPPKSDIARAAALLRAGGLVAFPTETVYGLGADALNVHAVARVFEVKGRPRFDPLIVHVAERSWLPRLTTGMPDKAARLADAFWPGPLTLVLPKSEIVPDLVTAGSPTVAVRIPDHPVAQALLHAAELPIAGPSANPFGRLSPTTADHVRQQLGNAIDLVLDGGSCRVGVESTVLHVDAGGEAWILRPGGVTQEEIEDVIGPVRRLTGAADSDPSTKAPHADVSPPSVLPLSPGTLPQHYAPRTPLRLVEAGTPIKAQFASQFQGTPRIGLLAFQNSTAHAANFVDFCQIEVLSTAGDLREAAANFFAALRRLDDAGLDCLVAELFPDLGLGRALNDRLRRAAEVPALGRQPSV